ncbi:MAG: DNA recombination protein RmuC [Patescibacteria group bacterium]
MTQIIIGLSLGLAASIIIFFLCKTLLERHTKSSFGDLSRKALTEMMPSLLELAKSELGSMRLEINKDVEKEKGIIKNFVENFGQDIKEKHEELKLLTREGNRQFGAISESIKGHKEITEKLKEKTENLANILSSNKLRGDWGERVAEDILRYAGFLRDIHYVKQTAAASGTIPDFTILLPNQRKVNIDAKFPFDNLQAYQAAESEDIKKEHLRRFSQDVKNKIREVCSRAYINQEDNTLDYVILFVPSEAVFGFINDYLKEIVDHAFAQKVLITSPTSLYATLRIIMESYRHFAYEKNIREILKVIQGFIDNFKHFQDEFSAFDGAIAKLRQTYDQIAETRYNKMKVQIRKIEKLENLEDSTEAGRLKPQD